jgi:hypothetical protein
MESSAKGIYMGYFSLNSTIAIDLGLEPRRKPGIANAEKFTHDR